MKTNHRFVKEVAGLLNMLMHITDKLEDLSDPSYQLIDLVSIDGINIPHPAAVEILIEQKKTIIKILREKYDIDMEEDRS